MMINIIGNGNTEETFAKCMNAFAIPGYLFILPNKISLN